MSYREPTGEARWANVDFAEVRIHQAQHVHQPGWIGAYLYCLKVSDYESAHLIRIRNDERYTEWSEAGAASVFPLEAPRLVSLSEAQEESEAA